MISVIASKVKQSVASVIASEAWQSHKKSEKGDWLLL
jgi:hypothetical protein